MIIKILHKFTFNVVTGLSFLIVFCFDFLFFRGNRSRMRAHGKVISSLALAVGGIKLEVRGLENIPAQPVIFMPNHQSDLDWPILFSILPGDCLFLGKKELFEIPIFGYYLRSAGHIPIDRSSIQTTYCAISKVIEAIKSGKSMIIFPEGTRSPDGRLGEIGLASFTVVQETNVPVVPIAIDGSFKALRKGNPLISPSTVKVNILEPMFFNKFNTGMHTKEFCTMAATRLRRAILKGLNNEEF